jgi:type II secretory pathway pseudopilin PulG
MKMKKRLEINSSNGFTLIELILYVGIIAIFFAAIVPFSLSIVGSGSKSAIQQEVADNGRFIVSKLNYEIRRASGISSVSSNSLSLANFSPDSTTLIDLSSGNIRINKNGSGAVVLNSPNVTISELTFTNNSSTTSATKNVSYTMTVSASGIRKEFQSAISLRGDVEMRSN